MQRAEWRQEYLGAWGQQRKSGREGRRRRGPCRGPCRLGQRRARDGWRRRRQGRCGRPQSARGERGGR